MRKSSVYLFIPAIALVVIVVSAGLVVSAQNTNSSTTMSNSNSAPMKHGRGQGRRRSTKKTATVVDEQVETETPQTDTPRRTGGCDPMKQEPADLSGTYVGKVKHGDEAAMDATLTITGNNFTMQRGSDSHSGRITAVTTCGYTAVTIMVGDMTPPAPGPNPPPPNKAMSLRAKKVGNSLTLTSVAGEPEQVMFTSGGGSMRPRRHKRRPASPPPIPPPPQQ